MNNFAIYTDTDFSQCSQAAQDDIRVIRQIEAKAYELHDQLDRLQLRWIKRTKKLEKHSGGRMGYQFHEINC